MVTNPVLHPLPDSIRNFAVLHIVTGEAKVFQTKERAPLLLCLEAFRPEEIYLTNPEAPLPIKRDKSQKKERDHSNYRSASWNSSHFTQDSDILKPLVSKEKSKIAHFLQKPYSPKRNLKPPRRTEMATDDLKLSEVATQQASAPRKTTAAKLKEHDESSKMTKAEREKQEMRQRVNKMLDKQASNPVIIDQIRRNDSTIDKVKVNDNYFNNYLKQASTPFRLSGSGPQKSQDVSLDNNEEDD